MTLGHYYKPIVDSSGNIVTGLTIEVRRESAGNPLSVVYSDREGITSLGSTFACADGVIDIFAVGGSYRIRAYKAGYDETFEYQAIGTAQEADIDTLLIPGYLFEFETATSSPPSDGCIRANNADLSVANRIYISAETIAGVDVSARTADMLGRRALITSAVAGEQVSWEVTAVTDHTTWVELALTDPVGATSLPAGRCGFQRESAEGPAGADGVLSAAEVILTGASETLLASHRGKTVLLNRATAMALAVEDAATLGVDYMVILKNINVGEVTLDPSGSETVDDAATLVIPGGASCVLTGNGTILRTALKWGFSIPASDVTGGLSQGKTAIYIPASSMSPRATSGAGQSTYDSGTNDITLQTLDFDTTTQEYAQFDIAMPKSWDEGTVTAKAYWTNTGGSSTQTVRFTIAGVAISNDDTLNTTLGTAVNIDDTWLAQNDLHVTAESSAITIGGSPQAEDLVIFQVSRDTANDNMSGDARLIGIMLYFTTNAATDA